MNKFQWVKLFYLLAGLTISLSFSGHADESIGKEYTAFTGLESDAAAVVLKFQRGLELGDITMVMEQLADDLLLLEGKLIHRTAQDYAQQHMLRDMKFLQAVNVKTIEHHVEQFDNVAFSIARISSKGIYQDKEIDSIANETIILRKTNDGWKITHVHWSN